MTNNSFSIRLREARLMMKLSMDKLVARTNGAITKQSISRYEKGIMRPKCDALRAIAQALNISEEYFKGSNLKIDIPMYNPQNEMFNYCKTKRYIFKTKRIFFRYSSIIQKNVVIIAF